MPPENKGAEPGSQWPKGWIGGGDPDVKWAPEKIGHAASILEEALAVLGGNDAVSKLQNDPVTAADLGDWDAGRALAVTTQAAHDHITSVYQEWALEYAAAAKMLRKMAARYTDTEHALTSHARQVGAQERQATSNDNPTWPNVPSAD
ncbi:hypothetical protein GCM10023196_031480 [Actinoallomurus vinaceus]|uniref:PE domain-containing protein n=1 Tax=Actinoallomurus vinaceus TaxID=1080074 RepID=A0ABP8U9I5_9ACTN